MRRLVVLVLLLLTAGCAAHGGVTLAPWRAPLEREHPLTGRIWDVRAARFVDSDALTRRLAGARYVLLGEKHDNPDHHQIQAALVRAMGPLTMSTIAEPPVLLAGP